MERAQPRVLVTRRIPQNGLNILKQAGLDVDLFDQDKAMPPELLKQRVQGCHALLPLVTDRIDAALLAAAGPQLCIVANYAVGYNNIDISAANAHRVLVTNTPNVLTDATADQAFALLLAAARRIAEGDTFVRSGAWRGWGPLQMLGMDVTGKTLGIIGMGRIGQEMARRALGFKMSVLYYNRRPVPEAEAELGVCYTPLQTLLQESDFVSVHAPLTPETTNLISTAEFERMKPSSILINTARGPVVDEKALVIALQQKQIWAAGLDVFEQEPEFEPGLAALPNVVLAPHLGSATLDARQGMARLSAQSIVDALAGHKPQHLVNIESWTGA